MWEKINTIFRETGYIASERLKVPNGWLIRSSCDYGTGSGHIVQTFIEDKNHEWVLTK